MLYNQNGTEMSEESFFHIDENEIIYVKSKGKLQIIFLVLM